MLIVRYLMHVLGSIDFPAFSPHRELYILHYKGRLLVSSSSGFFCGHREGTPNGRGNEPTAVNYEAGMCGLSLPHFFIAHALCS